ncbi:hypothetical protein OAT67_04975 [Bacteriovoracaceae bacterium]|nr:hypothetical protein [Bacteriovoracaceae bacterium]
MKQNLVVLLTFFLVGLGSLFAQSDYDYAKLARSECLQVMKYHVKGKYKGLCKTNYQHFNSDDSYYKSKGRSKVKIGEFNLLYPGSQSTQFKDREIIARIINKYDVVAALEVLPLVGKDAKENRKILDYISSKDITKGKRDYALKYLRIPDYIKILDELRKLDRSWSLLLSGSSEALARGHVREYTGFYYRSSKVKPIKNEHCSTIKRKSDGYPYACFPDLNGGLLKRNVRDVFSKRPFMASFVSGKFDFTLLTSHIVFGSTDDESRMKKILKQSFNVDNYRDIGAGVTKKNYARFAEVKVILELMGKLRENYNEQDVIFLSDMNIEFDHPMWEKILGYGDSELYMDLPTTVSYKKYDNGLETNGFASDYDHVILNSDNSSECKNSSGFVQVERLNFQTGNIGAEIQRKYIVRTKAGNRSSYYTRKLNSLTNKMFAEDSYFKVVRNGKLVEPSISKDRVRRDATSRVFDSQFNEDTFYRIYKEIVSDHYPIGFSCSTSNRDDD